LKWPANTQERPAFLGAYLRSVEGVKPFFDGQIVHLKEAFLDGQECRRGIPGNSSPPPRGLRWIIVSNDVDLVARGPLLKAAGDGHRLSNSQPGTN
jgi:hypothetical protein